MASTPASPFDSEFESWLHTATLGAAPLRGTNLPDEIVTQLQELAKDTDPSLDKQEALRDSWAQYKIDAAAQAADAQDAAATAEQAANTSTVTAIDTSAKG